MRPTFFQAATILNAEGEVRGLRVYLDLAVLLNAVVDFLLLMGANTLAGFPAEYKRTGTAAALGGIYGGLCLLPEFGFLGKIFWRCVFLVLMGLTAFGWNRGSLKRTGIFLLLSMAMGGVALLINSDRAAVLALSAVLVWLLCQISFGGSVGGKEYIPVKIRYQKREIQVLALRDTGNSLKDPVTGQGVLILGTEAAMKLTGLTRQQLASPLETMAKEILPGLRLIPYTAVGRGGMLLAMGFEEVTIGQKKGRALVAFDSGGLGTEQMYQALTGGV